MVLPCQTARRRPAAGLWWYVTLLALVHLLGATKDLPGTAAYMTSGGAAGGPLTTGSFATLMILSPAVTSLAISGRRGDDFSESLTVTSRAGVPLPIAVSWDGPPPPGATVGVSGGRIGPGESVAVTIEGTYAGTGTSRLKISIGQEYDWTLIPVSVRSLSWDIDNFIRVEPTDLIFYTGETADPKVEEMVVARVYATSRRPTIRYRIFQEPADTEPVVVISPESSFEPTAIGTEIRIYQERAIHRRPTHVTLTFTGDAPYITGSKAVTFTLAHSGDRRRGSDPAPDPEPGPIR